MKRFSIGDIHGGYKALLQCIERSNFDPENDLLISVGDLVDGWPESKEVFDYLMKLKNFVFVLGNHDKWFWDYLKTGITPGMWTNQGGRATLKSFSMVENLDPYRDFLNKSVNYWEEDGKIFVHGGFPPGQTKIENISSDILMWDRDLIQYAYRDQQKAKCKSKYTRYDEVYLGHTSTFFFNTFKPMNIGEIWNLDTGGGYEGYLTIIDIDTKEYWQSDKLDTLYPGVISR